MFSSNIFTMRGLNQWFLIVYFFCQVVLSSQRSAGFLLALRYRICANKAEIPESPKISEIADSCRLRAKTGLESRT